MKTVEKELLAQLENITKFDFMSTNKLVKLLVKLREELEKTEENGDLPQEWDAVKIFSLLDIDNFVLRNDTSDEFIERAAPLLAKHIAQNVRYLHCEVQFTRSQIEKAIRTVNLKILHE